MMVSFYKSLVPGALFSWIVSMVLMNGGTTGGALYVHRLTVYSVAFPFSWMLFIGGTGLAWFILHSMD